MMGDYLDELLDEIAEDLKRQKEEAQKVMEDMGRDKNLWEKIKAFF